MNNQSPCCLLTNDVETHSIWHNELRDETGQKVTANGLPLLLDIYAKYNVKTTFFFTGYFAEKFPEAVKMVFAKGHEVASHGYSHRVDEAFDTLSLEGQIKHLKKSKDILQQIIGEEVLSFRAPALRVNKDTPKALAEIGFKIDSSVASQRFDMFISFGGGKKLNWLKAPRNVYRTHPHSLFRKGDGKILEIPLSAFIFPYLGTTMRIFPTATKAHRIGMALESRISGKPIVFDIHPNEFIEEKSNERKIKRRSNNYFSYLLKDVLRGKMKVKNLGKKAIPLYEKEIEYFKNKGFHFSTLKDFAQKKGLLQ